MAKRRRQKSSTSRNPIAKFSGLGGGGKHGNMMNQIQEFQQQMESEQDALEDELIEISVGGGMIVLEMNGHQKLTRIEINPEVVDPDDVETLQDLIMAAVNEASEKTHSIATNRLQGLAGGLNIPIPGITS